MHRPSNSRQSRARLLVVSILLLALLALTAINGDVHFHRDAQSAANCGICQVARASVVRVAARTVLHAPVMLVWAPLVGGPLNLYFPPFLARTLARAPPV